ncbi:hypothetical protein BZA05DRAFT_463805 [Tricharina praecox]|uniref:uncharacterized protein n=1 Tax=Tricharina praecox TaxID=43433 RepID=UPI00221EA7DC|nr:uncharacterized protein BZA05DRAFT_463805 [Tricharina praecox]KAI5856564.1 hypothetical protein BZA05DRAFT_463805 [Tricharina praecox]
MSLHYLPVLLTSCIVLALAAPASPNITDGAESARTKHTRFGTFEPEPKGRGTWGLLFSCTVTFGFCVWTAVHPNIIRGVANRYRFCHKAALMVVSIIVPEGMIVCAFGEWWEARKLNKAWKTHCANQPDYLGMDGAFFVVMGGFVLDPSVTKEAGERVPTIPEYTADTATLTSAGFLKHLRDHRIDTKTFDKAAILDKCKVSNIMKLFSSFQAIWLFASCFARWNANLPLTLLEIHVLIQVGCTMFTFAFWWNKPLDINEPLTISLRPPKTEDPPSPDTHRHIRRAPLLEHEYERPRKLLYIKEQCPSSVIAVIAKAFYDILVNFSPIDLDEETDDESSMSFIYSNMRILMELFFVVSVGIFHATAWNVEFPSSVERILWRVSTVGICIFPVCLAVMAIPWGYQQDIINVTWEFHSKNISILRLHEESLKATDILAKAHAKRIESKSTAWWMYQYIL